MKRYCKNDKPFVYAVFFESDAEQAKAVLQAIGTNGVSFWYASRCNRAEIRRIQAAFSVVVFLSGNAVRDEKVLRCIGQAVKHNKLISCVYLEPTPLSDGLDLLLNSLQSVDMSGFADKDAFIEKMKSSAAFSKMEITDAQKKSAQRRGLASVVVPIVAAVAVFFAIVVPLLIVPAVKAATGSLSRVGFGELSLAELAKVEELYVAGMQSYDEPYYAYYINEDQNEIFLEQINEYHSGGDISDISDLTLLKNVREIAFSCNQITDVTPLFELTSLEWLTLNCNPIRSIEGIETLQNLRMIDLSNTQISDITPLFKIHSLDSIDVSNTNVRSIDGIENMPHLLDLRIGGTYVADISALKKIDYSYVEHTNGFTLFLGTPYIRDFSALQSIPRFCELVIGDPRCDALLPYLEGKSIYRLALVGSDIRSTASLMTIQNLENLELSYSNQLVSLDGLEVHTQLRELRLTECTGIEDFTVLLELPNLELLCISANLQERVMAQLGEAKFEIFVEALPEDMQNDE